MLYVARHPHCLLFLPLLLLHHEHITHPTTPRTQVHLSDAYLESGRTLRGPRTRQMLAMMGISVLSGSISTLGASFFLLLATIVFFTKFGTGAVSAPLSSLKQLTHPLVMQHTRPHTRPHTQ